VDILPGTSDAFDPHSIALCTLFKPTDDSTWASGYNLSTSTCSGLTPGSSYLLRFAEVNNQGSLYMAIDNVSLQTSLVNSGGGGNSSGTLDDGGTTQTTGGDDAPEPGTLMLLGSGFVALGVWRRKAKSAQPEA